MKYLSTFTGVGGFDMGMPPDWECVGMSEIDKHANMVLRYRFKDVKNYGDIEKISYEELPDFDVLIGGSPCQDVSLAGKRAGLSGVRSRLFFSYVAILKVKKPRYFIFENVKGLLSSNEGKDFAEVTSQFTEAGYDIWWQVLDASDFGIPQHRERIFILGTPGGSGFRKVFLKRKNEEKDNGNRAIIRTLTGGAHSGGLHSNMTGIIVRNKNIRRLTPLECERLQGWPDDWTKYGIDEKGNVMEISDNARYNLIGNGVVPQVVRELIGSVMIASDSKEALR
jgi:DNA (cytosine-5)-methyltransferase 1